MKFVRILTLIVLGSLWVWLAWAVVVHGGGFTLKNLIIIVASALCVFIPLWRKFFESDNK